MSKKTQVLRVRLTEEEAHAFIKVAESLRETRSRLLRKMIREAINQSPDLLSDERSVLLIAIRQLVGIARNLNQVTAAMHSGAVPRTMDEQYLSSVISYVKEVKNSFEVHIRKTKNRWIKSYSVSNKYAEPKL